MARTWNPIALRRDCDAVTVPHGDRVALNAGGEVEVVQQLGTSITVRTELGTLLRIAGNDADALGIELDTSVTIRSHPADDGVFDIASVREALHGVYDPEIPISIIDLGLVYRYEAIEQPGGRRRIEIDMTMTAPGCGMGDVLRDDAARAVAAIPGVNEVDVTLVYDPPWSIALISDATKLELGLL